MHSKRQFRISYAQLHIIMPTCTHLHPYNCLHPLVLTCSLATTCTILPTCTHSRFYYLIIIPLWTSWTRTLSSYYDVRNCCTSHYCWQTKLWEGSVFPPYLSVILFMGGGGLCDRDPPGQRPPRTETSIR